MKLNAKPTHRFGKDIRQKRKRVKGMTLVECIIALLVFTIAALIMVTAGSTACKLRREASHISNKTDAELPIANVRDVSAAAAWTDASGNTVSAQSSVTVTVGTVSVDGAGNTTMGGTNYATYNATKYNTAKAAMDAVNADTALDADLEFYVIETTAPTT